jgi:hypothetical protein
MPAKKKIRRASAEIHRTGRDLRTLSAKAKDELRTLLKRHQAGTITRKELDTGLKELDKDLKKLSIWIHICP